MVAGNDTGPRRIRGAFAAWSRSSSYDVAMPRTRPDVDRETKVDELVDAAVQRLMQGGYANLSVADIARELGL